MQSLKLLLLLALPASILGHGYLVNPPSRSTRAWQARVQRTCTSSGRSGTQRCV